MYYRGLNNYVYFLGGLLSIFFVYSNTPRNPILFIKVPILYIELL